MIEHIKTTFLWLLILLSVFLTYQIWTFQPNYAILKSTEYIDNTQIGEEKKLQEIIRPKQVVIHHEGRFFSPKDRLSFLDDFYEQYSGSTLERVSITSTMNYFMMLNTDFKMELRFSTSIPIEAIKEIFTFGNHDQIALDHVDQIIFFLATGEKEQINAKLISNKEQTLVEVQTNISVAKFKDDVLVTSTDDFYEVFPFDLTHYGMGFKKTAYLPLEDHYVNTVTFLAKPIQSEHFKQVLFSDPSFVKHYFQSNGEESFTDGNRMVNILQNGSILRYINPTFGDKIEGSSKPILFTAMDFLNSHGGFTNSFYFDAAKKSGSLEEVTFRLAINGIPVYSSNLYSINNLFEITLHRSNGVQIDQYIRPLFFIEPEPFNITQSKKLISGQSLVEELEKREYFDSALLTDINYGFIMIKRQSFIIFEPRWFIYYNGKWEIVNYVEETGDSEEVINGLE